MDYMTGINTSYADTYDKTSSDLTDKINGTDFSKASDDELMSVCKDFESSLFNSMASIGGESDSAMSTLGSYFGDEMIKNYAELFTESDNGKGLGIAQTLYQQMKRNYTVDEA